ncbi:MAG: class I SAM-dependent methyltransferase [Verrucomicrobiota bacterium]
MTGNAARAGSSDELKQFYDAEYYLNDCGGFEAFRRSGGKQIEDVRHQVMIELSRLTSARCALDLGCGRGEIAYQLALGGARVTAVDYSAAAIELAKSCLDGAPAELRQRIDIKCADATTTTFGQTFDLALAGDLVEHLSPGEVANLFANVSRHLEAHGVFVIHTYPNLWFYKYHHPRVRTAAAKLGRFIPAEPRTRYELLMHINEQSPAGLRRQLAKAFPHVCVWVGAPDAPAEGLLRKLSRNELIGAPDIYALASHSPLDLEGARKLLTQLRLPDSAVGQITIEMMSPPSQMTVNVPVSVPVRVRNNSAVRISSMPPHPVRISYHWYDHPTGELAIFEGLRTRLPRPVQPGETRDLLTTVQPPEKRGDYRLEVMLVQEGCRWFDDAATCVMRVN